MRSLRNRLVIRRILIWFLIYQRRFYRAFVMSARFPSRRFENIRNKSEIQLQFAAVIERRFQRRSKPEIEGRSEHWLAIERSRRRPSISILGHLFWEFARFSRESMLPLEKRQHVDQFKAPVDIRRAARPAELIALRAPRRGVSELARSRGLFKPAS